jgi:hypothetical protein
VELIKKTQMAAKPKKVKTEEIKKKAADSPDEDLFTIYLMYFVLGLLFLLFLPITLPVTICVILVRYYCKNRGDKEQALLKPEQSESWLWRTCEREEKSQGYQRLPSADIENSLPSSSTKESCLARWSFLKSQSGEEKAGYNPCVLQDESLIHTQS